MESTHDTSAVLELGAVFTLFFVTLGPLKILGPFAKQTHALDERLMRQLAVRAFALGLVAVIAGGFAGRMLLENWRVPIPALLLAGGIVFFLVGLSQVLDQYQPAHPLPAALPALPIAAALRVTFPIVVTPYGVAAVIVLLARAHGAARTMSIVAILSGVMLLNLLAMLYARRVMAGGIGVIALQILGAVLGVLQLALAVDMVLYALGMLGVVP